MNNPSRIQFTNGNVTKYVYSATGEKLRTIHQTAAPNITVAMGTTHELTASELLYTDSTDYYHGGKLTVKNGRLDKYYFDGGYAQATMDEATQSDDFAFFYYTADHLGNIREVIDEKGDVVQITNYYPFGTPYSAEDCATHNPDQQNHKYNGKEFDSTHGLNTYDYGARQYCSLFGRWDRMDNLCENDYTVSPYVYCHNNPVNRFDSDGNIDYFSNTGKFLYSKGSDPSMYVQRGNSFVNLSSLDLRNNANRQTAANIVGHYAREVGISYNQNGGTGTVGVSTMHGTDATGKDVLAGTSRGNISIKVSDGKMNDYMYNMYQLKGTLRHENEHKKDYENRNSTTNTRHAEIILIEMSHSDFTNSTKEYQQKQVEQLKGYIQTARKEQENDKNLQKIVRESVRLCKSLNLNW